MREAGIFLTSIYKMFHDSLCVEMAGAWRPIAAFLER